MSWFARKKNKNETPKKPITCILEVKQTKKKKKRKLKKLLNFRQLTNNNKAFTRHVCQSICMSQTYSVLKPAVL